MAFEWARAKEALEGISPEQSYAALDPVCYQEHRDGIEKLIKEGNRIVSYEYSTANSREPVDICHVTYLTPENELKFEILCHHRARRPRIKTSWI